MGSGSIFSTNGQFPDEDDEWVGMPESADVRLGHSVSVLPTKQPPRQDHCLLHGHEPLVQQPNVIVTQFALTQVVEHSESNLESELGGALLGKAYQHHGQLYVEVMAAVPAVSDDKGPIHFKFTSDAWSQIHRDWKANYPDLEMIGWFHTHPDLGVFYSADDEVVHAAAFTQPWHVGLVVDPVRNQASFFGWEEQKIRPMAGFYELIPPDAGKPNEMPRTAINWQVVIDESWVNPGYRAIKSFATTALPPVDPWIPMLLATLSLIMSIITLIVVLLRTS